MVHVVRRGLSGFGDRLRISSVAPPVAAGQGRARPVGDPFGKLSPNSRLKVPGGMGSFIPQPTFDGLE